MSPTESRSAAPSGVPPIHVPDPSTVPGPVLARRAALALDEALRDLALGGSARHRGVHQARKAIRRARAALRLGGDAIGPGLAWLDRRLARIGRSLSPLRDAQALVEAVQRARREDADAGGEAAALLARAERAAALRRARVAKAALAEDPDLQAHRDQLRLLRAALDGLAWERVDAASLEAAVGASREAATQAWARAKARDRDEDWHRWRRRSRWLAQQRAHLKEAAPPLAKGLGGHAERAALLGEAQDYVLLKEACGKRSPFAKADRAALLALALDALARLRARAEAPAAPKRGEGDAPVVVPLAPDPPAPSRPPAAAGGRGRTQKTRPTDRP